MKPRRAHRDITQLVEHLVGRAAGIIKYVEEVERDPGGPAFFHYAAEACDTSAFVAQKNFSAAGGAATDRDSAMAKAMGEAVERYCAAIYALDELPLASYADASFPCVHPGDFALHDAAQYQSPGFPWVPFTETTPVRWVEAADPLTGESRYLPAAMVYCPYTYRRGSQDSPIGQSISTGLACHMSLEQAALSGLYEVVERDAFTITWQAMLAPPQIRVETLDDEAYDLVRRIERTGRQVTLFNITMDVAIPSILAVVRGGSPEHPALVFAASSDLNPSRAALKALEEAPHTGRYSLQILDAMPRLVVEAGHANVIEQKDHLNFYCDPANVARAEFIFASKERQDFDELQDLSTGDPAGDVTAILNLVSQVGHQALLAELTTPDVAQLGMAVVRAVIPGFHPLYMGYRWRGLGGRRLWEVPQRLGHAGITPDGGDNPYPHPYP